MTYMVTFSIKTGQDIRSNDCISRFMDAASELADLIRSKTSCAATKLIEVVELQNNNTLYFDCLMHMEESDDLKKITQELSYAAHLLSPSFNLSAYMSVHADTQKIILCTESLFV